MCSAFLNCSFLHFSNALPNLFFSYQLLCLAKRLHCNTLQYRRVAKLFQCAAYLLFSLPWRILTKHFLCLTCIASLLFSFHLFSYAALVFAGLFLSCSFPCIPGISLAHLGCADPLLFCTIIACHRFSVPQLVFSSLFHLLRDAVPLHFNPFNSYPLRSSALLCHFRALHLNAFPMRCLASPFFSFATLRET